MPEGRFHVDPEGVIDVRVVQCSQNFLGPESLSRSDGRDDLLRETASFRCVL